MTTQSIEDLVQEIENLRHRLQEAEGTLHAIRNGKVDAVLVEADRVAQLQHLTAALSQALSTADVAEAIVTHGLGVFGSCAGVVAMLSDDGKDLVNLRMVGYSAEISQRSARIPTDAALPLADAVRVARPIVLETPADQIAHYPELSNWKPLHGDGALVVLPLVVRGRAIGSLRLAFATSRTFSAEDLAYMQNLAQQCAQALERARLFDAERRSREVAEQEIETASAWKRHFAKARTACERLSANWPIMTAVRMNSWRPCA